jgi:methionine biosynthesis protein MetW
MIFELVRPGSTVLDLGCGNGELLARLQEEKGVIGQGVEADPAQVAAAITAGVPVYQSDMDLGLAEFKTASFDYAILEKTLQTVHRPMLVLAEMLRIGRSSIVSFPNFGFRQVVENLARTERMPVTQSLPYGWHDTPNIHLFTLLDFMDWVEGQRVKVVAGYAWSDGNRRPLSLPGDSTLAEELLFVLQ